MSKTKTYFLFLLAALLPAMSQIAFATEPDTIWTIGARGECWFTPDGTKILVKPNQCLNTSDGSVIWDYKDSVNRFSPNGYFSQDSLYFYDTDFDKYRISDGAKVATKPDFTFDTIPDFFRDSSSFWTKPRDWSNKSKLMLADENTFYYIYYQDSLNWNDISKKAATRSLLCKYDKSLDSIVLYKPLILNGDTNILYTGDRYGYAEVVGYVLQNNTVLVRFYDDSTYRQYSATTLDSVSQFIYDRKSNGWVNEHKISYNGKYLGMGTTDGESKLGWIIIYDLTNNSIYSKFLDTDSSTSVSTINLCFSRNDSFLVATGGNPTRTKTWDFHNGSLIHSYDYDYRARWNVDVSPDNTKIIAPNLLRTSLLRARWTPVTSVEEESEAPEMMLVYPNPGTDEISIDLNNVIPAKAGAVRPAELIQVLNIKVYNLHGIEVLKPTTPSLRDTPPYQGGESISIDVSSLANGEYIIVIEGRERKISRKLIINR